MPNEWVSKVLGPDDHIILFMSFNEVRSTGSPFQMGIHPGLRHLDQKVIDRIIVGLTEGIDVLRTTPLDDLTIVRSTA